MVVHCRRGCHHHRHHPPLSNADATAAVVVVHDTVLQCIARRHLLPSQWWLIAIWSRCLHHRLPTDGSRIRVGGIVKIRQNLAKKGGGKGVFTTQGKHNHGHLFEGRVIWISLVVLFHNTSALLHLVARPSCRDAVGHG